MKTAEEHDNERPSLHYVENRLAFYRRIQADALRPQTKPIIPAMTPAENFINAIGEAAFSDAFSIGEGKRPGYRTEAVIRQIQADVLRWAAQLAIERGEPKLFHAFTLQANLLDPLPKSHQEESQTHHPWPLMPHSRPL